ncbi:MAG: sulfite exporter TauE/SafE family protein [Gammaproteobacteria bacterium]
MIDIFIKSLMLGAISGFSAGLFGIGGGMIIVPVLTFLFSAQGFDPDLVMIMSIATSLATIIFTSMASMAAHHRLGAVLWERVFDLGPGIVLGSVAGAIIADFVAADSLRTVFILYLILVATQLAMEASPKPGRLSPSRRMDGMVAVAIGLTSTILGIGGGTLTVPYLVFFRTPMRNAVAVASACGLPIAVTGTVSYAILGESASNLPEWSLGYVHIPSFLGIVMASMISASYGAEIANRLPSEHLKRYFSLLLFVMAAKMIWG